jgi:hypothetical protein
VIRLALHARRIHPDDHPDFTVHLQCPHAADRDGQDMKNAVLSIVPFLLANSSAASAESLSELPAEAAPVHDDGGFGKQVMTKVVDATNGFFAKHVDRLSHEWVVIRVDGEQQRAKLAIGAGLGGYRLRVASDVTVVDGTARVTPRLALAVAGKSLDVRLPTVDVAATTFRGERGVELRLPVVRGTF